MAKARTQSRIIEQEIGLDDDNLKQELAEETMDESADPLEESGRTVDSSDEEVEDSVADDIARFEESFTGINKRFRLINRIGEGKSIQLVRFMQGSRWSSPWNLRYFLNCVQGRRPGV